MDEIFYDLQNPILLNAEPDALARLADQYRSRAHEPLNLTMSEFLKAISGLPPYKRPTVTQSQGLMDSQNWLAVVAGGLKDFRTCFLHTAYHFERLEPTKYHSYKDPVYEAFAYFVEDTLLRGFAVGEKTAQLWNHLNQWGLAEDDVTLGKVYKRLGQTGKGSGLERLVAAIQGAKDHRHAYVHRFDPEVARSSITPIKYEDRQLLLLGTANDPLLASTAFQLCEKTYRDIDEALAELLGQIDVMSLRF